MSKMDQRGGLERLQNIDPFEFEKLVGELWERQGFDVELTDERADGGLDAIATRSDGAVDIRVGLQAKRYTNQIGPAKVREYAGVRSRERDLDQIIIVATAPFSDDAQREASEMNVKLVDGERLLEIVEEVDAWDVVDRYAPSITSSSLDPADTQSAAERDDVHTANDVELNTQLPEPFDDTDTRRQAGAAMVVAGIVLATDVVVPGTPGIILGTLVAVGGLLFAFVGDDLYDSVTPDITVFREFEDGSAVIEYNGEIRYRFADDREDKTFDAFEDDAECRQQANLYGVLLQKSSGGLDELEGAVPTDIVSEGEAAVAAYRFAVQAHAPERIAAEMNLTQERVVSLLEEYGESL